MSKKERQHDYGCLMLDYESPFWESASIGIDENDLYIEDDDDSYGIEKDCHVTVMYGLHDEVHLDEVKPYVQPLEMYTTYIVGKSLFENPKYDVLKFDILCPQANLTFDSILNELPNSYSYDEYNPHMTIAYLKPGMGKKYLGGVDEPIKLLPYRFSFSHPFDEKKFLTKNDL